MCKGVKESSGNKLCGTVVGVSLPRDACSEFILWVLIYNSWTGDPFWLPLSMAVAAVDAVLGVVLNF